MLLPKSSRALQDSYETNKSVLPFLPDELPTVRAEKAWQESIQNAKTLEATGTTGHLVEHVCTALIRYRTPSFVKQAEAAFSLINKLLLGKKHYIKLKWIQNEINTRSFVEKSSYSESYLFNAPRDASSEYCIVIQETEDKLSKNILGLAYECGYCNPNFNVAYVSEMVDDSLTTYVILHEIGHLFCAKHSTEGIMKPFVIEGNTLSGSSVEELYEGLMNSNWGGPTCMASKNVSAHQRHCHDTECTDYHTHRDAYSETGAAIFFTFIAIFFLLVCWATCYSSVDSHYS